MKKLTAFCLPSLCVLALLLGLGRAASAQEADPPDRVARLNYMQGSVSIEPAGTTDWIDANPNRPLTTGDNLWADRNARGELHIGSTTLRIASETGISFLILNDQTVQIQLAQGSLDVRLRQLGEDEAFEIDTANLAFSISQPGEYRIDTDASGASTVITVRSGGGAVTGGGSSYDLDPGQQYTFSGASPLTYDAGPAPGRDDFDAWCLARDERENAVLASRYVSPEVTGYEDLDAYGVWRYDPVYGEVWVPSDVAAGWAPYHYGYWVFIAPWGWTWVENEPWGFAPFHYGRWALVGGAWGWVPGPMVAQPVYAPALVGFVGGRGFGATVAIGGVAGVAWFPLGPRDVWVPAYRASPFYVRQVNVTNTRIVNVTEVNNVYLSASRNFANGRYTYQDNVTAVTAVSRDDFVNGRPVAAAAVRVTPRELQQPQVVVARGSLAPTPESRFGPARQSVARPPVALASRPVVTRLAAAPRAEDQPRGFTPPPTAAGNRPAVSRPAAASSQPQAKTRKTARTVPSPKKKKKPSPCC